MQTEDPERTKVQDKFLLELENLIVSHYSNIKTPDFDQIADCSIALSRTLGRLMGCVCAIHGHGSYEMNMLYVKMTCDKWHDAPFMEIDKGAIN